MFFLVSIGQAINYEIDVKVKKRRRWSLMQESANVDLRGYWNGKIGIRMKDSKRELQDLFKKYSKNSSSKSFEVGISLCCWTIEIVITQSWNPRRIFDLKTTEIMNQDLSLIFFPHAIHLIGTVRSSSCRFEH